MDSRQVLYTLNQLQLTATGSITELAGHVYKSVEQYQDTATKKYSELLDEQNHVIGIVEAESVTTADGVFQSEKICYCSKWQLSFMGVNFLINS